MVLPVSLYEYAATIVYVVDGDTVDLLIDLGFKTTRKERVRFYGVNAPERGDEPGYQDAKDFVLAVQARLMAGQTGLFIRTRKDVHDVYGRYLAYLYEVDPHGNVLDLSAAMIAQKLAVPFMTPNP